MNKLTLALLLSFVSCDWESHEEASGDTPIFVQERQLRQLSTGSSTQQVIATVGAPRAKEARPPAAEVWRYGVYRGEGPSLLRFFVGAKQPPTTLLDAEVTFHRGKLISVRVIESSARILPSRPSTTTRVRHTTATTALS